MQRLDPRELQPPTGASRVRLWAMLHAEAAGQRRAAFFRPQGPCGDAPKRRLLSSIVSDSPVFNDGITRENNAPSHLPKPLDFVGLSAVALACAAGSQSARPGAFMHCSLSYVSHVCVCVFASLCLCVGVCVCARCFASHVLQLFCTGLFALAHC